MPEPKPPIPEANKIMSLEELKTFIRNIKKNPDNEQEGLFRVDPELLTEEDANMRNKIIQGSISDEEFKRYKDSISTAPENKGRKAFAVDYLAARLSAKRLLEELKNLKKENR